MTMAAAPPKHEPGESRWARTFRPAPPTSQPTLCNTMGLCTSCTFARWRAISVSLSQCLCSSHAGMSSFSLGEDDRDDVVKLIVAIIDSIPIVESLLDLPKLRIRLPWFDGLAVHG